jgi:alpha-tubulin suppressor-like RCC1 family protein
MRTIHTDYSGFASIIARFRTPATGSNAQADAQRPDVGGGRLRGTRLKVAILSSFTVLAAPAASQCEPPGASATAVSAGMGTCAVLSTGSLRCWGQNTAGDLGLGTATTLLRSVESVATDSSTTCAVLSNGGLRCWGNNRYGQLGIRLTHPVDIFGSPPSIDVLTGTKAVALGASHTCALLSSGGVRCWGATAVGQLGLGWTPDGTFVGTPPSEDVLTGVTAIAAGGGHTCALLGYGGVRCWGDDTQGQLGGGPLGPDHSSAGAGNVFFRSKPTPDCCWE